LAPASCRALGCHGGPRDHDLTTPAQARVFVGIGIPFRGVGYYAPAPYYPYDVTAIPPMDIILAAFSLAALSARPVTVRTTAGVSIRKRERRPAPRGAAFFIRGSVLPLRPELTGR